MRGRALLRASPAGRPPCLIAPGQQGWVLSELVEKLSAPSPLPSVKHRATVPVLEIAVLAMVTFEIVAVPLT